LLNHTRDEGLTFATITDFVVIGGAYELDGIVEAYTLEFTNRFLP